LNININIIQRLLLFCLLVLSSCSKIELQNITSEDIQKIVRSENIHHAVMLNFWATWCKPCVSEFPMIVDMGREYENNLSVYFISVDWLDEKNKVRSFLKNQGVDWQSFIKNENDQKFINGIAQEWTGAVPFTILYGKSSGKVVDFWEGEQPETRFRSAIIKAINS